MLIQRRDKIKSVYLTAVNPIVNPRLDGKGLTFENAAVAGGVAQGAVAYRASLDDVRQRDRRDQADRGNQSATTTIAAPSGLPSSGFVAVDIAADSRRATRRGSSPCAPTSVRMAAAGSSSASTGCPSSCRATRRQPRKPTSSTVHLAATSRSRDVAVFPAFL